MPQQIWKLQYARRVTQWVYNQREDGHGLHTTIKPWQFKEDPLLDAKLVNVQREIYETVVTVIDKYGMYMGYWVQFKPIRQPEKVLMILRIEEINQQPSD